MTARTILVVDDSSDNRLIYGSLLEVFGYRVVEACNGDEGVHRAVEHLPDLILMDVAMPVMNGIEATRALKENPRTSAIPLLILSAHDTEAMRAQALSAGCDAYLMKPVGASRMLEELQRLLPPAVATEAS